MGGRYSLARLLSGSIFTALCLFLFSSACLASQAQITGVRLSDLPGRTELVLELSHPANYKVVAFKNPDRLVIDLENTSDAFGLDAQHLGNEQIIRIRSARHNGDDLRVVLDLKAPVDVQSLLLPPGGTAGHRLLIRIPAPIIAKKTDTPLVDNTTAAVPLAPKKPAKEKLDSASANVSNISLESTAEGGALLVLELDRPVAPKIMVLTEPDRIVLDLEKTSGDALINAKKLGNELVHLVRSRIRNDGQLRIVMDLKGPAYAQGIIGDPDGDGVYRLVIGMYPVPVPSTNPISNERPVNDELQVPYDSDKIQLKLDYQKAPLGTIDAIEYDAGYMLPLSQLFQLLGFPIEINTDTGLANGWFIRPNWNFILDVNKNQVIVKGKQNKFSPTLVQIRGRDIYVDSTLLEKFFPVLLQIDPARLSLSLKPNPDMPATEQVEMVKQWLMSNGIKPEPFVTKPVVVTPEAQPDLSAPIQEIPLLGEISDEDLIVLQPSIEEIPIDDFIEVYQIGERFLLPLQALSDILHFSITVRPDTGKAEGWFLSENRKFFLDTNEQRITLSGEQKFYPANTLHVNDTDIFVDSRLLSQWFPIDYQVDLRELRLVILPRETLPFQLREKRLKKWARIQQTRGAEKSYPLATTPYKLSGMPFMDLNFNQIYRSWAETKFETTYSLVAAGDLGYLNTNLFVSGGSKGDALGQMRLTSGKRSDNADLLGQLKATQFFVGDINSITVPQVAESSLGRGLTFSNRPLFRSSQFDSTNFIGNALPDWEVELYRNGALIDFQLVGADGRYEFIDVPIQYGNNTFQLIFQGPQGQIREEVKRFNIGNSILRQGELIYELSVDEKSQQLFGIDGGVNPLHPKKVRAAGELEYGLTNALVSTFGLVSTPLRDGEHRYVSTGLRSNYGGVLSSLDAAYDESSNGWATKLAAFGSIKKVNLKAEYRLLDNFNSEELNDFNLPLESKTEFNLNTTVSLPFLRDLYFSLNARRETYETGTKRTIYKNKLAKSLLGIRFTNTLENNSIAATDTTLGALSFRGRYWSTLLRGNLNYSVEPDTNLDRFEMSAQRKTYKDAVTIIRVIKNLQGEKTAAIEGSMNWHRKNYIFSLLSNINDQSDYSISANLIFSLGRNSSSRDWFIQSNPMANSGGLAARAFLDSNFNQQVDDGEEIIDQARFTVNKVRKNTDNGLAFVTGLPINRLSTIKIDSAGDDPLWMPAITGYQFLPRPGVVTTIDFPVITTSEIDGTVYLVSSDGQEKTLSRISVQLVDAISGEIVKTFKSEYDGFYLLENVRPGKYLIRIREKDLERLNARVDGELTLEVGNQSDVYSGLDLKLTKKKRNIR